MKMPLVLIPLLAAAAISTGHAIAQPPDKSGADKSGADIPEIEKRGTSDPFGQESDPFQQVAKSDKPQEAERGALTEGLEKTLQEELEIQIGTVPLNEFVVELGKAIAAPVFFQPHPEWTEVSDGTSVTLETSGLPLEVELKKALRPLALRAIAHDDALVIIPDTVELARRGIGTSRYISIDENYMQALEDKFAQPYSQNFNGIPLEDAIRIISEETKITFVIDTRALEDLGLTRDLPIRIDLSDVAVYDFIQLMLRDSDLTLQPRTGYVMITTIEEAENPSNQISRVYWLDGTGLSIDSAADTIESTIDPDTWEALGGPSSTAGMHANEHGRMGLVVLAPYLVHREVERLLQAVRQGVVDPRATFIDPPSSKGYYGPAGSMGSSGMGGMGMGGMAPGGGQGGK